MHTTEVETVTHQVPYNRNIIRFRKIIAEFSVLFVPGTQHSENSELTGALRSFLYVR